MTTRTPTRICPENAFMKENYIQTKLKGICFQQEFLVICKKEVYEQVSMVLILKLWCDAPHQTCCSLARSGLGLCLWQQKSHVPTAGSARKVAAEHRETWDMAMVPKGQRRREWEIFKPQMPKRYFRMQILRGWFFAKNLKLLWKR